MEVWVQVADGTITHVECGTSGCDSSQRSVRAAADWATGRSLDAAAQVQQSDILAELNGLPPEWEHCALLAANTMRAAVTSAQRALAASRPGRSQDTSMGRSQLEESDT
jgi:NifU-like protein involved in Fe-S cluster formation